MNKILITRIADNKTFSEESLAELLRDEGIAFDHSWKAYLLYNEYWFINYKYPAPMEHREFNLDPAKYKISFANTLDIERVREMIEEMRSKVTSAYVTRTEPDDVILLEDFDFIASKYL